MINIISQMQEFLKYFCTTKIMEHFTLQLSVSFPSNDISIVTGIFMFMFRRLLFVIWFFFFWLLYCLSLYDLQLVIVTLVSSKLFLIMDVPDKKLFQKKVVRITLFSINDIDEVVLYAINDINQSQHNEY